MAICYPVAIAGRSTDSMTPRLRPQRPLLGGHPPQPHATDVRHREPVTSESDSLDVAVSDL